MSPAVLSEVDARRSIKSGLQRLCRALLDRTAVGGCPYVSLLHSMIVQNLGRILISGASGLIGSALIAALEQRDYAVTRLKRNPCAGGNELAWDSSRVLPPELV